MNRLVASLVVLAGIAGTPGPALAQLTTTPGPGGIPIAPGAPVQGWTPGGVGIGGGRVAPGPAARDVPMYRRGPGDVPVLVTPEGRRDRRGGAGSAAPDCGGRGCLPDSLRLTIDTAAPAEAAPPPDAPIESVKALFAALRACWTPPAGDAREPGMEMTVRFGLTRDGALMGPPSVTYATKGATRETREAYRRAIAASLDGCDRLRFSERFGRGIAGRPLFVRYIDGRRPGSGAP
ncbi:hypothetical protein PQJ75_05640 [Rhodoplanes sp. TEM]|uniref:TonB C-terminal domain-containing protein n=1 Tax=Rhodoplanes tepidamans TaxID=200616 RepID=A0ABT5J353_RHOTP|nr:MULTISPECIES: hypothetical protein [Rhodoplanes]MDC7784111.1 hypothetical protein [Rhodoplanes tepidamans]MDC7983206.1 hypothetical protein [Rhodoplanes sp. TEM]MDQ0356792.1 hypothetical protein [Rhodoplanes tepidamans]